MNNFYYPVLCPLSELSDGYRDDSLWDLDKYGSLNLDVELKDFGKSVLFRITFRNDVLRSHIIKNEAKMTLILEAKTSLVRKAVTVNISNTTNDQISVEGDLDELGIPMPAEATVYIVSTTSINDYRLPGAPSSMGKTDGIKMPPGAILGYSLCVPLLPKPPSRDSILVVESNPELTSKAPTAAIYSFDRIRVQLEPTLYNLYLKLKDSPIYRPVIAYAVSMPALVQAITLIEQSENNDTISGRDWYLSIKKHLDQLYESETAGISIQDDPFKKAHYIMNNHISLVYGFNSLLSISAEAD